MFFFRIFSVPTAMDTTETPKTHTFHSLIDSEEPDSCTNRLMLWHSTEPVRAVKKVVSRTCVRFVGALCSKFPLGSMKMKPLRLQMSLCGWSMWQMKPKLLSISSSYTVLISVFQATAFAVPGSGTERGKPSRRA